MSVNGAGVGCHWRLLVTITPLLRSMEGTYHGQVCIAVSACCTCRMCCYMSEGAFDPTSQLGCSDAGPKVAEGIRPSSAVYHLKLVIGYLYNIAKTVFKF